jgi:hypothetical protein
MTRGFSDRDTVWYVCCYLDVQYVYASIGDTDVAKRGCFWLGVDRWGHRSSKGVEYDILAQGLIRLIECSYHQGIPCFLEAQREKTLGLSVLAWSNFMMGD